MKYPRPANSARTPAQYLLYEPKPKTSVVPSKPALEFHLPFSSIQNEAAWAGPDKSWKNLCPAYVHRRCCPGDEMCSKEKVCNQIDNRKHVSISGIEFPVGYQSSSRSLRNRDRSAKSSITSFQRVTRFGSSRENTVALRAKDSPLLSV